MDPKILEKLDAFFKKYKSQKYKKGDILIHAGESPSGIIYLKYGNIRQYIINKNGREMTLNIFKPFSFFPMTWALDIYTNNYYFEAMNDLEVVIGPKEEVLHFVKKNPDVLLDLLRRIYIGLEGILSRMEHLMSGDSIQRLSTILIISAKRFGESQSEGIVITPKLTHQDLASLAGLSRETVSREMMQLKKNEVISYTKTSIIIKNLKDLERIS